MEIRKLLNGNNKSSIAGFHKFDDILDIDYDAIDREMNSKFGHEEEREHERQRKEVFEGSSDEDDDKNLPTLFNKYSKEGLIAESSSDDDSDKDIKKYMKSGASSRVESYLKEEAKKQQEEEMHMEDNSAEFYKLVDQNRPTIVKTQPKQGNRVRMSSVKNSFAIDPRQQSIQNLGFDIDKDLQMLDEYNSQSSPEPVLKDEDKPTPILLVIENNEKLNEAIPESVLQEANKLLSFTASFYKIDSILMLYEDYPAISKKLQDMNNKFWGALSCISMIKTFMFVGNSNGIIRVFDMKKQVEMKPLVDYSSIGQERVMCMDIDEDSGLMLSGYKDGGLALWDLLEYKLLKYIPNHHTSEITNIKFASVDSNGKILAVTCEDNGAVRWIEISKRAIFGGYNYQTEFLFKSKMTGTNSIAVYKKHNLYPHEYCENSQVVAFGALNIISIVTLKPIDGLYTVQKPTFCRERSLPYLSWGFGLTPSHREQTVPILAFGWDRIIQLIYINEQGTSLEIDGYFISDMTVISLHFMAESTLFVLFESANGSEREVKILSTTKFYPGTYKQLELLDPVSQKLEFRRIGGITAHAVLEKSVGMKDVQSQLMSQSAANYTQSVQKYKQNIMFLSKKNIQRGRLFSWKEYIEHIRFTLKKDWLGVLKMALDIYNGELKGFAGVPDDKDVREGLLKNYMKDLVKSTIEAKINVKYVEPQKPKDDSVSKEDYSVEETAINAVIEFCLSISACDFLFTEIFDLLNSLNLRNKFIQNLEPFIISGQFRREIIPESILKEFLQHFQRRPDIHNQQRNFERIVSQLDLDQYSSDLKGELGVICTEKCMVSALLYLQKSENMKIRKDGDEAILFTLHSLMNKIGEREKKEQIMKQIEPFGRKDILMLNIMDSKQKYEVEKSRSYIGYKLLWIIKLYLEGRQFPYGSLAKEQWKINVLQIARFLMENSKFVNDLIDFDSVVFLDVIQRLFYGEPYWFLDKTKSQKNSINPDQLLQKIRFYVFDKAREYQDTQKNKVSRNLNKHLENKNFDEDIDNLLEQDAPVMKAFYEFFVNVQVEHFNYRRKLKQEAAKNTRLQSATDEVRTASELYIDSDLLTICVRKMIAQLGSQLSIIGHETQTIIDCEAKLIQALSDCKELSQDNAQLMLTQIEALDFSKALIKMRIFLLEFQGDYLRAFRLILLDPTMKDSMFTWIHDKFTKLSAKIDKDKQFIELKNAVAGQMRLLIEINGEKTIEIIERWFDDAFSDQLIVAELGEYPEEQFSLLQKYLLSNESIIKSTLEDVTDQTSDKCRKYIQYICLFVQLMCQLHFTMPDLVSEELIEAYVKKTYYPLDDCLNIVSSAGQLRAIAALKERKQEYIEAINTNIKYLNSLTVSEIAIDILSIIEQALSMMVKNKFQTQNESKREIELIQRVADSTAELQKICTEKWEFEQCYKYKFLKNFDETLIRMIGLANKDFEKKHESDAFFSILQALFDWFNDVKDRLKQEERDSSIPKPDLKVSHWVISRVSLIELLQSFIIDRQNSILMFYVPVSVDPKNIIMMPGLDFTSIKKIFNYKVKAYKQEKKVIKKANQIIVKEIGDKHQEIVQDCLTKGYMLEGDPVKRLKMEKIKRFMQKDTCDICTLDLVTSEVNTSKVSVYIGCGHTFHSHCVSIYLKEKKLENKDQEHQIDRTGFCPKCYSNDCYFLIEKLMYSEDVKGLRKQNIVTQNLDNFDQPKVEETQLGETHLHKTESLMNACLDEFDRIANMSTLTISDFDS